MSLCHNQTKTCMFYCKVLLLFGFIRYLLHSPLFSEMLLFLRIVFSGHIAGVWCLSIRSQLMCTFYEVMMLDKLSCLLHALWAYDAAFCKHALWTYYADLCTHCEPIMYKLSQSLNALELWCYIMISPSPLLLTYESFLHALRSYVICSARITVLWCCSLHSVRDNRPFPSCLVHNLSCGNELYLHVHCLAVLIYFQMNGCAPGLVWNRGKSQLKSGLLVFLTT